MGLMTEPAWDSNQGRLSKTDFHRENLRNLKKLQQVRTKSSANSKTRQPVKAFAFPESGAPVDKKYGTVQPRLYDWTMSGHGPDPAGLSNGNLVEINGRTSPSVISTSKNMNYGHVQSRLREWSTPAVEPYDRGSKPFLRGHEKTGPFLPSSASSVVGLRRVNSQRTSRGVARDFDSVADDEIHVAMAPPSRFGDVSIDERKRRIMTIVSEIYSVTPLCKENLTHKTLEKNLRRTASCDQVSEVGSIRAGTVRQDKLSRYSSNPKLNRMPSSASSMISVNNVEPLTRAQLRRHDAIERELQGGRERASVRGSTTIIKPTVSKSFISPRHHAGSPSPPERAASRNSRNSRSVPSRQSRSATPNFEPDNVDAQSVIARGVDVDYVNANVESVSTVGHHRRKEKQAVSDAARVTKPSLILPDSYKSGAVPKYLKQRQVSFDQCDQIWRFIGLWATF